MDIGSVGPAAGASREAQTPAERLRKAAHDFEGVFVAQLFREMRATVPTEESEPGAEMFTAMLDDALAAESAGRSERGLGEALYRQLARRLNAGTTDGTNHGNVAG